jgi:hypothetical protein
MTRCTDCHLLHISATHASLALEHLQLTGEAPASLPFDLLTLMASPGIFSRTSFPQSGPFNYWVSGYLASSEEFPLHNSQKGTGHRNLSASDCLGVWKKIEFSRMPHGCIRTMGTAKRRKGLQVFRKDLAGVHLGRRNLFSYTFHLLVLFSLSSMSLQIHDRWIIYLVSLLLPASCRKA